MNSYPTRNKKFKRNSKKIQKIRKHHHSFFSSQNNLGKAEKGRKLKLSFRSVPTRRVIENSKKISKKLKKIPLWLHFKPKQVGKGRKREKIIITVPFHSYPARNRKFQKKQKKFKKLKNCILASFQARIGQKSMRKRENKNCRSVPFLPDAQQKIPKKQQKN